MCVHWLVQIVWVLHCLSVAQNGQSVELCLLSFRNVCVLHCSGFENYPANLTLIWSILCILNQTSSPHTLHHCVCLNNFRHFSDICHCLFPHQSFINYPWLFSDKYYIYFNQISITGFGLVPFLYEPNIKHCSCSHESCVLDPNIQHSLTFWRGESTRASHAVSRGGSARALHAVWRGGSARSLHSV